MQLSLHTINNCGISALQLAALLLYSPILVIDLVLFIPIEMILHFGPENGSLSNFVDSIYDTSVVEETFSMMFYSENADIKSVLGTSSLAGVLFGAVHCLAWNFSFPSHVEQIMWRAASLGVITSCAAALLTALCFNFNHDPNRLWEVLVALLARVGVVLSGLAAFIYPVARIILLVLGITSLRSLPSSAFDTINWIDLVPHI